MAQVDKYNPVEICRWSSRQDRYSSLLRSLISIKARDGVNQFREGQRYSIMLLQ